MHSCVSVHYGISFAVGQIVYHIQVSETNLHLEVLVRYKSEFQNVLILDWLEDVIIMSLNLYVWTQSSFPIFYFEAYKKVIIFIPLLSCSCVSRFGAL
jgi:hypothetical protein